MNGAPDSIGTTPPPCTGWQRALVVDDDDFSRRVASRSLRLAGLTRIEEADAAALALNRIAGGDAEPIDLVLCDLQMPSMDGIEFLRRLADLRFEGAIVLVSGADPTVLQVTEELARARRLNVLGVLEKPVRLAQLVQLLERRSATAVGARPAAVPGTDPVAQPTPTLDALRQAVAAGEIHAAYQAKVDVVSGRLCGVEVLARWTLPSGAAVAPDVFVPMAEADGLIDRLTDDLMGRVFAQMRDWSQRRIVEHVAVNVAMASLCRLDFPDRVLALTTQHGIDPATLTLEVTESQLMDDVVACADSLLRLRLRGIGLAIDDFGTRYASLAQLRALPFTELKIDRSFVHGAATDVRARAILESSVALGRALGMTVVAEGVEDDVDWQRIVKLGCQVAQGYFIARPLAAEPFERWAKARRG